MLQGTFETLALPELLGLLGHTRKTGALWLDAGPASAVVYVVDGRCCAAVANDAAEQVSDARSLLVRLVDLCFGVARTEEGSFKLGMEEPPWKCPETVDLDVVNDDLARLLDEWREIQRVIPSLECRPRLSDELGIDELIVDRDRWRLLTAIDGRRSVRELVRRTNRPVLEVCHALLAIVDAGACTIGQAPAVASTASRSTGGKASRPVLPSSKPAVDPENPWGPGVDTPHPGGSATEQEAEPVGARRGPNVGVFSALRDA